MGELKVAIVGCGKIADGHVEEIQKLGHLARIVAVCDREMVMARQLAVRYGVPNTYDDYDAMLRTEKPDVVHVTTPPQVHKDLAMKAIDAGAHVFVEKPLTLDYAASRALVEYADRAKKKLGVGYSYHFEPHAEELRNLVRAGAIGDVVHLESFYGYDLSGAFGKALLGDPSHWVHAMPGKLLQNTLDHALAKIVEFIPDERPEITAFGSLRREARFGDRRDELCDEARIVIRGQRVTSYVTFSAHARPVAHTLRVYGTKNTAHLDYNNRTCTLERTPTLPSAVGRLTPAFENALAFAAQGFRNMRRFSRSKFHFFAGLGLMFERYYESILKDSEPPVAHRDILRVAWMLDRIFAEVDASLTTSKRRDTSSNPTEAEAR
ncbi:MAG: Gfo/Idh/MocA family oxidoreductase [Polyangiaceae bacterium]|nr:Gfo/Idh/MocA family oxidoreductase [Polyangiaceae bacterium]